MTFYQELQLSSAGSKQLIKNTTDKKEKWRHILIYNFKVYLVMAFCVAVVTLYTKLTGQENSVAGVTVLLALLVLRQADFGIRTSHGLLSIVGMFTIMMAGPRLANAMKHCMKTAPVEKITVKEIVEACGVTRQTFYRNFQDKYDLINWYFDKILLESFEHMGEGKSVYEGLVNKFTYIQEEKLFFKAAFKNDDQNCLRDHDFQLITAFYTDQIESRTGKKISPHLQFQLEMYCQGSIFMTVQWVLGCRKCTPEELARSLAGAMPAELSDVFREVGLI